MFWDYESDSSGTLLNAVNDGLIRTPARREQQQMTTTTHPRSVADKPGTARLASIDILRGITMTVMIFVNELRALAGCRVELPHEGKYRRHDLRRHGLPIFLIYRWPVFALAVRHRLKKTPSLPPLWMHVALRTASLMTLGLILANADDGDGSRMLLSPAVWAIVALIGAALS